MRLIPGRPTLVRRVVLALVLAFALVWLVQLGFTYATVLSEWRGSSLDLLDKINRRMLPYLFLSFPLILLPIWFAVTRGLRPLKELSERIAQRDPDDLAPLRLPVQYEELAPLSGAIDQLMEQLRSKVAREHGFVQDAAHELRTPLAALAIQAHALAAETDAAARAAMVRQMEAVVGRTSHMVQQLLDLARLEGSAQAVSQEDAAAIVAEEIALLAPQALARGQELLLESPDTLPARVDAGALRAIVRNLVANAVRYVQDGGTVSVRLGHDQGALRLEVEDNGPGIAADQRALVFERFHRGQHDVTGSGLGLAIVRQAAQRCGGSVTLSPGPHDVGCRFSVSLPDGPR